MALSTFRIFISSPGDVAEERLIARRVIGRLDAQFGDAMHVEAVFWEHQPLVATASFQEQLLRPSETDLVIAILWSRLGTVLPGHLTRADGSTYASGTEFEFEDAVEGFRQRGSPGIMAYRKTAPAALPADATQLDEHLRQRQALERFVAKWFMNEGDGSLKAAFHPFASPADFEDLLEAHLTRLIEPRLPAGGGTRASAAAWREGSPFRGLEAFEPQHAPVFFGRTGAVASVLMRLRQQAEARKAFVLVVSMSGGGKSSLIRAGVLPLLLQPGVVGSARRWRQAIVRPSDGQGDLVAALARALAQPGALPALAESDERWEDTARALLADAPSALADHVCQALDRLDAASPEPGATDLALVVDQIEEMFSDPRIVPAERQRFVAALDALARCGRVWVLATLRNDVYPRLAELPVLMALKEGDGQFDLLPPTPREIGQIIRLPAAAAGLRFEQRSSTAERLDETIRDAAAKNPGALPLLQFLLEELYQRRNPENVLTFRAYEELGGVEGALARRAEAVLAGTSPQAQDALPRVLRELVTFGTDDESKVLRRVAPRDAFETPAAVELVDALLQARLLVSGLDEAGQPTVALAHEALLEFWPRLREWQDRDRELLHLHARLSAAARTWERQGRGGDFLLARGKPLADARVLVASSMRLSASEAALVDASERRSRQFVRLRAAAVVGLAGLTVVASIAAYRANVESGRAQVQATTAQRTTDFMVSLFSIADPEENRGEKVTVREILDKGVTQIQGDLAGEASVRSNLLRSMGQAYNGLGLYPKANEVLTEALKQAEKSGIPADLLKAHLALAENRYQEADYPHAEAMYRQALGEAVKMYGDDHPMVARALTGLGESISEGMTPAEAESYYRRALGIDLKWGGEQSTDTARVVDALGRLMYFAGRYSEAEVQYQRALVIKRQLFGSQSAIVGLSLNNLGLLYFETGRYDDAVKNWTEALLVYRAGFGPEHRYVASPLNNLGRAELLTNQLTAAQLHLTEALAISRKTLPAGHDDFVFTLNSLAMVKMALGDLASASTLLDEALTIARSHHHRGLYQVLASLAELALRRDQLPAARITLGEARKLMQSQYGERLAGAEAWRSAVLGCTEASLRISERDFGEAQRLLQTILPILEQRFGKNAFYTDEALRHLVALFERLGQDDKAAPYRRRLAMSATK